MKKMQHSGPNRVTKQTQPMPGVRNMAPGPAKATAEAPAPASKGNVARSAQGGSTSPKTDSGGGMGNSSVDLHKHIFGK